MSMKLSIVFLESHKSSFFFLYLLSSKRPMMQLEINSQDEMLELVIYANSPCVPHNEFEGDVRGMG
jgi:hypothetical protein